MAFDPNNPAASGMVLTFDDEFSSPNNQFSADNVADNTQWSDHVWWAGAPAQFGGSVHDGVLDLNTAWAEMNTINSAGQGFGQKYGYFEARIWSSGTIGGGFFLMSQQHAQNGAAPASELDVVESAFGTGMSNNWYRTTLHSDSAHPGDQQDSATGGNPWVNVGVDMTQGFHTYSALWDPNSSQMTWYFDGKEVMVQPKYSTTDASAMFMDVLNGDGSGDTYIDYVRAWQFSSQNPTAVTPQPISDPFGQAVTNGSVLPGSSSVASGVPENAPGSGPNSVTVHVSGDQWQGDPQFVVLVDGQQVGGVQDVTAVHSAGQWQDITVNGTFANPKEVDIQFLNDAWGGTTTTDRNIYVGSVTVNGTTFTGDQGANGANNGGMASAPGQATMDISGTLSFNLGTLKPGSAPTPAPTAAAGDPSITLHVSGDHWAGAPSGQGDPQFVVLVDGQQVGGVQTVSAVHDAGQWQDITVNGTFSSTPSEIDVKFINDQFGGTHAQDVNLYVDSITFNGHQYLGSSATNNASLGFTDTMDPNDAMMVTNGTAAFHLSATPSASPTLAAALAVTPAVTPTELTPTLSDGAGHDIFVFGSSTPAAADISNFSVSQDILDLAPLLKAAGYTGTDPIADHVVALTPTGTDSTAVKIDVAGHNAATDGTTLVTLDHVLPQNVPAANIWH